MALPAAIVIGGIAAVSVPLMLRSSPEPWHGFAEASSVHFVVRDVPLDFSWPIFCVTTLIVWLMLRAARNR